MENCTHVSHLFTSSSLHLSILNLKKKKLNPSILYITYNPSLSLPTFLSLSQTHAPQSLTHFSLPLTNIYPASFSFFDIHIHLIFLISSSTDLVSSFLAVVCILLDFVSLIPNHPCWSQFSLFVSCYCMSSSWFCFSHPKSPMLVLGFHGFCVILWWMF